MARELSTKDYGPHVGGVDEKNQSPLGQDIEMQSVDIQRIEQVYR